MTLIGSSPGSGTSSSRWHQQKFKSLSGNLREDFQYLKGTYKKAGEGLFTRACSDTTDDK